MKIPKSSLLLALALGLLAGCPGNSAMRKDGSVYPDGASDLPRFTWPDTQPGTKDTRPADQYKWPQPDTKPLADAWPWPQDSYQGTPFGCLEDADCFGQVCCPTPWGVKICVDTCE
jgi:hypothetical protein